MVYSDLDEVLGGLTHANNFTPADAKHDKIDFRITGITLFGTDTTAREFLLALHALIGEECNSDRFPRDLADGGAFFLAPQHRGPFRGSIGFRKGKSAYRTTLGYPLIAGQLTCTRIGPPNNFGSTNYAVAATISLNPTKFIRHNFSSSESASIRLGTPLHLTSSSLLTRDLQRSHGSEHILDDNDNCILEPRALRLCRGDIYRAWMEAYVSRSLRFVLDAIAGAVARLPDCRLYAQGMAINLRKVETYWERASQAPLGYVQDLSHRMLARSSRIRVTGYAPATSFSRTRNAIAIEVPLRKGIALRVYAKTNHRVRFEVVHNFAEATNHLGTRHTTTSVDEFLGWVSSTLNAATDEISGQRAALTPSSEDYRVGHALAFFRHLSEAPGGADDLQRLAYILIQTGSFVGPDDTLSSAIDYLVQHGVLVATARGVRTVAPAYVPVLARLRQDDSSGDRNVSQIGGVG